MKCYNFKRWFTFGDTQTVSNFKKYYHLLEIAYEIVGLNHFRSTWPHHNTLDKLYAYLTISCLLCVPAFTINYLRNTRDDLEEQITCLISFFTAIQCVIKVLTIVFGQKTIIELRDIVVKHTTDENICEKACQQIAVKFNLIAGRGVKLIVISYVAAWFYFNAYPFFSPQQWPLPLTFEIPGISHNGQPGYAINYIYIFIQTVNVLMFLIAFDGTIFLFAIYIAFRLELCKFYFLQIGDYTTNYNTAKKQSILLMKCAKLHIETFIFAHKCSKLYSKTILAQLTTVIGTLCMSMLHIRIQKLQSSSCMMFPAVLFQAFLYCSCGEFIVSQAAEVTKSIYGSKWYNIKCNSERKILLFMLTSSQTPIGFSVGGIYKVSMQTFTEICKTAYSFCAFLMNVM